MQNTMDSTLAFYSNHLHIVGFTDEETKNRQDKVLEFSKILTDKGDHWIREIFSIDESCITESLLSIANVVASI